MKQNWFAMTREQQERLAEDVGMTWERADYLEHMEREDKRKSREVAKNFIIIFLVFTLFVMWGTRNNQSYDPGYDDSRPSGACNRMDDSGC